MVFKDWPAGRIRNRHTCTQAASRKVSQRFCTLYVPSSAWPAAWCKQERYRMPAGQCDCGRQFPQSEPGVPGREFRTNNQIILDIWPRREREWPWLVRISSMISNTGGRNGIGLLISSPPGRWRRRERGTDGRAEAARIPDHNTATVPSSRRNVIGEYISAVGPAFVPASRQYFFVADDRFPAACIRGRPRRDGAKLVAQSVS